MKKNAHSKKLNSKNNKSIRYKIRPVIVKKGNRFFYTRQILTGSTKHRREKKKNKNQLNNQYENIYQISEDELLKQYFEYEESKQLMSLLKRQPFLINNVQTPKFTMPEQLQVSIHEGENIDYTDNTLYYRISTEQILASQEQEGNKNFKISVPQMELNQQQYEIPRLVSTLMKKFHKANIWIYFGKRTTEWHYDGHDNFLYVLKGEKIIYLVDPKQIKSNTVFSLFNNHKDSQQQVKANVSKVIVKNGRSLFIPKGWWHRVESFGNPSMAINFWGDSTNQILNNLTQTEKTLVVKSLLFQLAEEYCKKAVPNWQNFTESQMEEFRKMAGHKLIEQGNWNWKSA